MAPTLTTQRPAMVGAASTVLILAGLAGIVLHLLAVAAEIVPPSEVMSLGSLTQYVLIAMTILVGLLIRHGSAWPLCLAVVGLLLIVDVVSAPSGNVITFVFVAIDAFVLGALLRHRSWFAHGASAT